MSVPQRSGLERCVRLLNTYNSYQSAIARREAELRNFRERARQLEIAIADKQAERFSPVGMLGGFVRIVRRGPSRRPIPQRSPTDGVDAAAEAAAAAQFEADKRRAISDLRQEHQRQIQLSSQIYADLNRLLAERQGVREAMVQEGCQAR
jgi:hypothetical protein